MTAAAVAVPALLGVLAGAVADRLAAAFPWDGGEPRPRRALPFPVTELLTAALFGLVALRLGAVWALPAFLVVTGAGVLLALVDLRHRLLPNRVTGPAVAATAALLLVAAAAQGTWDQLLRAGSAAAVLFCGFLVMALISPAGLGMGDVKLAALIGLPLGWLGWDAVLLGAVAGFVVQAAVALVLLLTRRVGRRSELPFGPAMLAGAALAVGWGGALLG
ncbi:A24 family peptidase [Blastococcus sp. BMG 814]|uniref:A24 family peptidase n=1 Tax=Blastococcus carthaginiensis TaxID=3050034 RepID=A0ABT9IIN5_9ACTN|nr:A24 family peptidase [Blastococcus carthaginiensis]MDP5185444.1 A24 family peptidase [Blastococcus carthaginiensis]